MTVRIDFKPKHGAQLVIFAETFKQAGEKLFDQYHSWPDCNEPVSLQNTAASKLINLGNHMSGYEELHGRDLKAAIAEVRSSCVH